MKNAVLFLSGLLLLSCHRMQLPQQTDKRVSDAGVHFVWHVEGCAGKAAHSKTALPQASENKPYADLPALPQPALTASGDSITYSRFEEHLCCRLVHASVDIKAQIITVTEYWFGKGCKCRCSSTVHAVIRQLPKGTYQVYAIATGTEPVQDKPTGIADTVLVQKVTIQ